jgi:toxin-antitoxin system PIN domain toxin
VRALFDINVLLALFDAGHQFHGRAREWLTANIEEGWASCPITQNGFIRVMSQPSYPNRLSPKQAMERLAEATQSSYHAFWRDEISVLDENVFDRTRIHGAKQLTDVYLLALAIRNAGRFVTFDDSVPLSAVRGAIRDHLVVL